MATKFLEPGGDADFLVGTTNGFWTTVPGSSNASIATDFVHGGHIKSLALGNTVETTATTKNGVLADAGRRISFYLYINALESTTAGFASINQTVAAGGVIVSLRLTSAGVLQIWKGTSSSQIGTDGATLSTGQWYRISLAYTITSTSVNRFELFVDGSSSISITDATLASITSSGLAFRNAIANTALDFRISDIYIDDSSALTDTGNIWVTAKRPNANGTTNGFTTQIGSGGSGYGTGHSPQVNERPLLTTNGWSMVGAGSAVTEEYNIEGKSVGDIDISSATIVDWLGWISTKALAAETVQVILDGVNVAQAITSTITLYTKIKGSATYPAGTGADIGITTDTSLTTVSLYECGIIVAYIPGSAAPPANKRKIKGIGRTR